MARTADFFSQRTVFRRLDTPLREFLRTETGGAAVLLAAAVGALVWVNVDASSYEELWETELSIELGDGGIELTLREWVNSGLMTFFFFVLGLEARREFDLGDLRERRRFALPLLASVGGMGAAMAIYLAFNLGSSAADGWGIAMSTDTALALGLLALFGRRAPDRLRAFMLTVVIADDLLALVVIAIVYSDDVELCALIWAAGLFAVALVLRRCTLRRGPPYFVLGSAIWVARSSRASSRWWWASRLGSWYGPRPPPARTSSTPESASASSASSPRRSSSARRARASGPRSRPTSGSCSSSITRGRAT